jgi:hypothetical protein
MGSHNARNAIIMFRVLGVFTFILLGTFLAFSFLGADSSGRKHRSVHISEEFDRIKDNTAFDRTDLRFLIYWPGKTVISHQFSTFH